MKERDEIKNDSTSLYQRLQRGDKSAFNKLVEMYQKKLFRIGYSYFQDKDEAMEIVQDVFIKVYRNISNFNIGTNFDSWIFRITSNLCIDRYRKHKREKKSPLELIDNEKQDNFSTPAGIALIESKNIEIKKAINSLSKKQRAVFTLKYLSYKKFTEISDILGIATGTVKSLHFRAINKIKHQISLGS
jgi:RNA polymerase sigma-70 factor (ECF subfamily)